MEGFRGVRRGATRAKVFAFVRRHLEQTGEQPTCKEAGAAAGVSSVAAWKHIQTLIGEGKLVSRGGGRIALPEYADLSGTPTDQLRGELARRGETMEALEAPKLLHFQGRPCAANFCEERVRRGMLMCRRHWFQLPPRMRSDIMNAWGARQMQAYQEAVEAARNHLGGFTTLAERVG